MPFISGKIGFSYSPANPSKMLKMSFICLHIQLFLFVGFLVNQVHSFVKMLSSGSFVIQFGLYLFSFLVLFMGFINTISLFLGCMSH